MHASPIPDAFARFAQEVIPEGSPLTPNEKAHIFLGLLAHPDENRPHPDHPNLLVTKIAGEVAVNGEALRRFLKGDLPRLSPEEAGLLSNVDALVAMDTRRYKGEFFTPAPVALLGDAYLKRALGEGYKERYVVFEARLLPLVYELGFLRK